MNTYERFRAAFLGEPVARALRKWQARHGIARIFPTELSYYGFARVRSGQNANAAQQAEPVRIPKRTQ